MKVRKIISCILLTACCSLFGSTLTINAAGITALSREAQTAASASQKTTSDKAQATASTNQEAAEDTWPAGPNILGDYAIVMEANTGTVLYSKNADEKNYPASITKILTALLAIENSEMDEKVTFSYDSVHKTEGSGIWRDVDEVMTMEQCLYALLLNSANECAYAIAEHVGGTYDQFVQMMNERVKALGCENTQFTNPHGLPDEEHYTTCYDMALIAAEAIKNDTFREITGTLRYDIPPTNKHPDEITYLRNHHKMLFEDEEYYYEYCIGGKTGYTVAARNTLVTYAEKDGMLLVCVVMREETAEQYQDTLTLLKYCFSNFRAWNIAENFTESSGNNAAENDFFAQTSFADINENAQIVLPVEADFADASVEVLKESADEDTAGTLRYTYGGHVVGAADVEVVETPVEQYPFEAQQQQEGQQEAQPAKKVIRVNVWVILLVILGVAALAAAVFALYKFKDNFYWLRYKRRSRRRREPRRVVIKKKRHRRRRR